MIIADRSPPHLPAGFRSTTEPGAPRVTIVTVVLNGGATIQGTLDSVARQTAAEHVEHLVVDGGSSDGTIGRVLAASHGPRLVVGQDHGIYDAFNVGLALARGEWIAFLNADDAYAHPRVIEAVLAHADADVKVDVFHADQDWVDERGRVVRTGRFVHRRARGAPSARADYEQFREKLPLFHQTTFCRRSVFAHAGGFDATYRVAGDYDLLLRAWLLGATFWHIPDVFVHMREGGISERARLVSDVEVIRAWRRRGGGSLGQAARRVARRGLVHLLERHAAPAIAAVRRARALLPRAAPAGLIDAPAGAPAGGRP